MNYLNYFMLTGALLFAGTAAQAQSADQNYVRTLSPRTKFSTQAELDTWLTNKDSVETTIEYFDGLGRPIQTVMRFGSPGGKDLVQPRAYDAFGRETIKYLPYAMTSSTTGNYKDNALDPTNGVFSFYNAGSGNQQANGMVRTTKPYSESVLEASPLNRLLEQGSPGTTWQIGTGNTVTMSYGTNGQDAFSRSVLTNNPGSNRVALYTAAINPDGSRTLGRVNNTANYATGQLYRTITWDENRTSTGGCLGSTEEYKDKEGRVVLKRTYNRYAAPGISTVLQQMSTYYVYDDLGNLSFVLPPAAKPDTMATISQTTLNAVCYQYRYDERNRMVAKKLPGKVWEYMVYNKLDQLVASQDSNLRGSQQWLVRKYDGQGRVVITGIFQKTGLTASAFRDSVYAHDQWDIRNGTVGNGYLITSYPATLNTTLTVNFYDSYENIPNFVSTYTDSDAMTKPTGMLTLSKKLILNTTVTRLLDVYYYDSKGRVHKTYTQHYLNGVMSSDNYDVTTTAYNFNDQLVTTLRQHYKKATSGPAQLVLTSEDSMVYDHKGRLEQHWNQLTNGTMTPQPNRLLSQQEYNEVGQLFKKKLHSTNNGSSFYQMITYRYNARGWMVQDSAQLFKQQLYYNDGAVPQYNGNISAQSWQTNGGTPNTYNYTYDTQNRLLSGIATNGYSEKGITYDLVGNMRTLARYQANTLIDSLRFNYPNNGQSNQPDTIRDVSGNLTYGAKTATMAYTYRGDGQVKYDGRTGNTISYNLLALPQTVTGTNNITYWYDAASDKLAKVSTQGSTTTRTDYIGGIQYTSANGTTPIIEFIQTGEGRARLSGSNYIYEYDLTDHLGNARLTFATSGASAQVVQTTDYYPFGMTSIETLNGTKSKYLYNKKELQEETNQYDYGARFYDPVIARWGTVDPLAEKAASWSPFRYGFDNPIRFIDPNGMYEKPKNWFQRLVNNVSGQGRFNRFVDFSKKVEALGGTVTNVNYGKKITYDIQYGTGDGIGLSKNWQFEAGTYNHANSKDFAQFYAGKLNTGDYNIFTGDVKGSGRVGTPVIDPIDFAGAGIAGGLKALFAASARAAETETVFRVFGGEAVGLGRSWTPINPATIADYRNVAGLPDVNTGQFIIEGTIQKSNILLKRGALELNGNAGGLMEYVLKNPSEVVIKSVSGVNPEF